MAQEKHRISKYSKTILFIIMALLLFGGPYLVYVLASILSINYLLSVVCGFVMVVAGLVLMWYLIKNKVVS